MQKKKATITNAMRSLTASKIPFEAVEYEADESKLSDNNFGMHISELTGIEPERSFKTLVGKGDKTGVTVFCIPVNLELDLKKAAKVTGNKKIELIAVKELLSLTGYIRGGVSPIGMKKKYPTFFHQTLTTFEKAAVSGGVCGVTLLMSPDDLIKATNGKTEDICV